MTESIPQSPIDYTQLEPVDTPFGEQVKASDEVTGGSKLFSHDEILQGYGYRPDGSQPAQAAETVSGSRPVQIPVVEAAPEPVPAPPGPETPPQAEEPILPGVGTEEGSIRRRYDDYYSRYQGQEDIKPSSFEQWKQDEGLAEKPSEPEPVITELDDSPEELAPERRSGFRALPERSRSVLRRMYDRIAEEPELRRVVGKMEIAYHQYFLDKNQERSARLKTSLDVVDARLQGLEEARAEIETSVADLARDGSPGSEALQLSLQKLDRSRGKIMAERDKVQTDFEAIDNKAKLRTTKRDAVADRLISAYDRELLPLETELEALQTARDQAELTAAVTEAKHEEMTTRAEGLEEQRNRIAESMRRGGVSEKDIRRVTETFDITIEGIAAQISRDQEELAARKLEIDKRVAKVDDDANPYRDKREEFVRIKNSRPIDIEVETRTREAVFYGETPTEGHPRPIGEGPGASAEMDAPVAEADPRPDISAYLNQWNEHLASQSADGAAPVDPEDFTRAAGIREAQKMNPGKFKKILAAYLKLRKVPSEQYAKALSSFLPEA